MSRMSTNGCQSETVTAGWRQRRGATGAERRIVNEARHERGLAARPSSLRSLCVLAALRSLAPPMQDTIDAPATPVRPAARIIVRTSGPEAFRHATALGAPALSAGLNSVI